MSNKFLLPADILLPKRDFEKWSVIACDQYTSQPKYWEEVQEICNGAPSAFNIILPEAYLREDNSQSIAKINNNMSEYLENDIFEVIENKIILTLRTLNNGKQRAGLVGLIDLEDYDFKKGAKTSIRATEETVLDRIPPRVKIRSDAPLEIPHIMLLINDPNFTVVEPVTELADTLEKIYDFDLMQNAGHIKGYTLTDEITDRVNSALCELKANSEDGLLFAVGDGNHSLATAKQCYLEGKGPRYALVEVVNIHDSSLEFEPIYRVVFGVKPEKMINDFVEWCGGEYNGADAQKFTCVYRDEERVISVAPKGTLSVATLGAFLDKIEKIKIDYIHGIESLRTLAKGENTLGFLFEGMEKSDLFTAVSKDGSLPRKTFSMGTADDKRFYLEARKL